MRKGNKNAFKHGRVDTRIYTIWKRMKERCSNPNGNRSHIYLERGITVCDEWRNNFMAFYRWAMANGYRDNLTIDRKDNDKGYTPENCRWATNKEQCNNTRYNVRLTYAGVTKNMKQWAEQLGMDHRTLHRRLGLGWDAERALTEPVKLGRRKVN